MALSTRICLVLVLFYATVSPTVAQVFCYSEDACGPTSSLWPGPCQSGTRQSPIDLPFFPLSVIAPPILLNLKNYRGSSFRMQNNGHTVVVDFNGAGPSAYETKILNQISNLF